MSLDEILTLEKERNKALAIAKKFNINIKEALNEYKQNKKISNINFLTYLSAKALFENNWKEILEYILEKGKKIWGDNIVELADKLSKEDIPSREEESVKEYLRKIFLIKALKDIKWKFDTRKSYNELKEQFINNISKDFDENTLKIIEDNFDIILNYLVWDAKGIIQAIKERYSEKDEIISKLFDQNIEFNLKGYTIKFKPKDFVYMMKLHLSIISCHSPGGIDFDRFIGKLSTPYITTMGLEKDGQIMGRADVIILPTYLIEKPVYVVGFASNIYPNNDEKVHLEHLAYESLEILVNKIKESLPELKDKITNFYVMGLENLQGIIPVKKDIDIDNDRIRADLNKHETLQGNDSPAFLVVELSIKD